MPVARDENILRLEIAMQNAVIVGGRKSANDLQRIVNRLAYGKRSAAQARPQGFTFKQFRDDVRRIVLAANIKQRQNIRMVKRSRGSRLLLKAAQALWIAARARRQNLNGNFASQAWIARPVNLTHSARSQFGKNFVGTEFAA